MTYEQFKNDLIDGDVEDILNLLSIDNELLIERFEDLVELAYHNETEEESDEDFPSD